MDKRFLVGVALIVLSLVIGKITTVVFVVYFWNRTVFWTAMVAYLVTWAMLFVGLYLCGKEGLKYAEAYTRTVARESVERTRKAVREGGARTRKFLTGEEQERPPRKTKKSI